MEPGVGQVKWIKPSTQMWKSVTISIMNSIYTAWPTIYFAHQFPYAYWRIFFIEPPFLDMGILQARNFVIQMLDVWFMK